MMPWAFSAKACMLALRGGICKGSLGGPTGEAAIGHNAGVASMDLVIGLGGLHSFGARRLGSSLQGWTTQPERALAFLSSASSEFTSRFTVLVGGVATSPRLRESSVDVRLKGEGVHILQSRCC